MPSPRYAAITQTIPLANTPITEAPSITLLPASTLDGRLTYSPSGKPAAGIRVYISCPKEQFGSSIMTDRSGHFRFTQLRPGEYTVGAYLAELSKSWAIMPRQGVLVPTHTAVKNIDLQLFSGVTLTGSVLAEDNKEPIANVNLVASQKDANWSASVTSGSDSRFCIHAPPGASHWHSRELPATERRDKALDQHVYLHR